MSSMWANSVWRTNNVKPKKPCKLWHNRALLIDLRKTRLIIEREDTNSKNARALKNVLPLTRSEPVKAEQAPSWIDKGQYNLAIQEIQNEPVETDQVPSSLDMNQVNWAIQEFQFSVTYYADSLEEQEKGRFSFHWLGEAFSHFFALLG